MLHISENMMGIIFNDIRNRSQHGGPCVWERMEGCCANGIGELFTGYIMQI